MNSEELVVCFASDLMDKYEMEMGSCPYNGGEECDTYHCNAWIVSNSNTKEGVCLRLYADARTALSGLD